MDFNVDVVKEILNPEVKRNMKYDLFTNQNLDTEINASDADEKKLDKNEFKLNSQTLTSIKKNYREERS